MKLSNIKLSLLFEKKLFKDINSKVIWKADKIVYTIYRCRQNLINITGIKSIAAIEKQKQSMEKLFQQKVMKIRIDNVFFSQKNHMNLDMSLLYSFLRTNNLFFVDYNIELFAGMYLHPKQDRYPTIVIFRTGSYQIMGGKSFKLSYKSEKFVNRIIEMFKKKPNCKALC